MAFSLRKMLSNITYFKKPEDDQLISKEGMNDLESFICEESSPTPTDEPSTSVNFERSEPDSTSRPHNIPQARSLVLPSSVKAFTAKKSSLSDTDLLNIKVETKRATKKCKKLYLDIKKAHQSLSDGLNYDNSNVENTPKKYLLHSKSSDIFSEKFKKLDFDQSFDLFDAMSDASSSREENFDIESLSEHSDSDTSAVTNMEEEEMEKSIKMCRKIDPEFLLENCEKQLVKSGSSESFGDVENEKNEEERITLLLNYQMKLEKLECFLKKLLSEFQFHIEVSKVFQCRSIVTDRSGTNVTNIPKMLREVTSMDNIIRGPSPIQGSWNIVLEKEDYVTKCKVKKQLVSIQNCIEEFVIENLDNRFKAITPKRSITFNLKGNRVPLKRLRINNKKKIKHYDYPDIRDAMLNLFSYETEADISQNNNTHITDLDMSETSKCECNCRCHQSETDSGLTTKNDRSISSQSITSSLGNFTLDNSTLTAYSESLDQNISYTSFQDTSLYSTLLQKSAIERITFYIQVHSIQIKSEPAEQEFESKSVIVFHCPSCKITEYEENSLLKHILGQYHCEKIHFLYKTAYMRKCMATGKEIQPSTVLNPMTMYRDENKIVCFGDAMYACSLCFENMMVGESVLMAHCSEQEHIERREKLPEILID